MKQAEHFALYIDSYRKVHSLETNSDLKQMIHSYCTRKEIEGVITPAKNPPNYKKQLKLVYQSLRIYVNDELGNIEKLMNIFPKIIRRSQSLSLFIGFHSLENKTISTGIMEAVESEAKFKGISLANTSGSTKNKLKELGAKMMDYATKPSKQEIKENSPSKSAELYTLWLGFDDIKHYKKDRDLKVNRGGWQDNGGLSMFDREL